MDIFKDEISSTIIPLLSRCNSASILDTPLNKNLTTTPSLTTTTAYQSHSLRDLNTRHALALQFPHSKWTNKNGNRESNSPFTTFPLLVLAVVQSSSRDAPIRKQWRVENYFIVTKFSWVRINHEICLTGTFLKARYFNGKFSDYGIPKPFPVWYHSMHIEERLFKVIGHNNRKLSYE